MTDDNYIQENKTKTFKKGDGAVMHTCYEASLPKYKGKVWKCQTDSFLDRGKQEMVFLEGFSGSFSCEYLHFIKLNEIVIDEGGSYRNQINISK